MTLFDQMEPFGQSRIALMAELRAGFAMRRPESFMCITGLTDGYIDESLDRDVVLFVGERMLTIPRGARDRYGHVPALLRERRPRPLYTRHTLGEHELARDVRRSRRHRR